MSQEQAHTLVRETFEKDFDRDKFREFIDRLLKSADFSKHFRQSGINIRKAFQDKIGSFERIAQFTDVDGKKIDVLIVNLKRDSTIERGRTSLRNFAADYLQSDRGLGKAAVLVSYVSESKIDWRFSYVTLEKALTKQDSGKFKEEITSLTPARRFSFLVGRDEKTHTAQKQFFNLLQSQSAPTLKQIEEAFSIEKVTDDFYKDYEKLFRRVEKAIESLRKEEPQLDKHLRTKFIENPDFSKKLLGQIVFLYFLQKKGWFGVERGAAWGSGNKSFLRYLFEHRSKLGTRQERRARKEVSFFNDILEHLFYDALARERDEDYYARFDCKIPFLNGGLFEAPYTWSSVDVLLPDALFSNTDTTKDGDKGTGILDVFDRYNFTVNEAEPLEKDVAVDPEMLGKVFENLLPENERKGKGSYYTPRQIVNYMCRQSLVSYLVAHLPEVASEDIETFIQIGDFQSAYEAARTKKHKDNFLPETITSNASRIDGLLEAITVCDPAIGSGAFPVGMMQEIVRARSSLTESLDTAKPHKSKIERETFERMRSAYEIKRHAIQTSLYGVDIDPGAVEIAKLRLWLSLIVDEDERERVKALPNLDYKIMQGNALLDEYAGVKLIDDAMFEKPLSDLESERVAIQERIKELTEQLYVLHGKGADARELKRKFSKETDRLVKQSKELTQPKAAENVSLLPDDPFREARATLDEIRRRINEFFSLTSPGEKREARERVEKLEWRFMEQTLTAKGEQAALKEFALHRRDNRKPYFLWKLYFSDVFQTKGGFDVVIGNPPYDEVSDQKDKNVFKSAYSDVLSGHYDLYIFFFRQAFNLAREGGLIAFITPHTFLQYTQFQKLRDWIYDKSQILEITSRIEGIFESAVVDNSLTLLKNQIPGELDETAFIHKIIRNSELQDISLRLVPRREFSSKVFDISAVDNEKLFLGFSKNTLPLGAIVDSTQGIIVYEKGQGEKINHIRTRMEDESCKPVTKGREINKYRFRWSGAYIRYGDWLCRPRNPKYFESPKIFLRQTADTLIATYVEEPFYCIDSVHSLINRPELHGYDLRYVLGVLNSTLGAYLYNLLICETGKVFAQVKLTFLRRMPIKEATPEQQAIVATLVDYVLFLKANESDEDRDSRMAGYFEQIIDALVYELYLPDDLHAADKRFFEPLSAERLPSLVEHPGKELQLINDLFRVLSARDHKIRRNLYFLNELESIRIIEGKE